MKIAKATFEGATIYGFAEEDRFYYYKNGISHIAYGVNPVLPHLSHYTDLVELGTVDALLKDISLSQ